MMQLKYDVGALIKEFYNLIKTQFSKKIKVLRSDNGFQFVNVDLKHVFSENGIVIKPLVYICLNKMVLFSVNINIC